MSGRAGGRGVALVLVLLLLVLLGTVAAVVIGSTQTASSALLNLRARTLARYAAESGVVEATALIERRMMSASTPAQQVLAFGELERELTDLQDVTLGSARFGVAIVNLNGRLDLNRADPAALAGLFSQFVRPELAGAAVDALRDWRDADDVARPEGAERDAYLSAGSPFLPRNAPLERSHEFRRILGVTESLATAVEPFVTVDGDLRLDVNAASEPVLAAVPGIGPSGARLIIAGRRLGKFTSIPQVLALLSRPGAGTGGTVPLAQLVVSPSRLLVVSRGWSAGHPLTHEIQAAYALIAQRLVLKSWRERDL